MLALPKSNRRFQPKLWPSCIAIIVFALLLTLGFWQLQRYHYKLMLVKQYQIAKAKQPIDIHRLNQHSNMRYQQIKARGHYLNNKSMLLQHRFYRGRVGYDVLTPFKVVHQHKLVLVNRGWIPRDKATSSTIHTSSTGDKHSITGTVKLVDQRSFILGKNVIDTNKWPLKIQKIDLPEIEILTHATFYPFVLRLNANQPDGFVRHWKIINNKPQRHMGYAIQWFAMALVLLIAFYFFSCKEHRPQSTREEQSGD